ncbi:hypothetical protein GCM10022240_18950 [Microbacterium kribbense]|uniref:Phosphatidylglycerol lysyltransferase C-terminal domain-containing protein n=1 Tax=Microbacterium kribbense TaxID=433645 RepID=A0ABP7GQ98_9MICO
MRSAGRFLARYLRLHPFSVVIAATVLISGFVFSLPRTHDTRWVSAGPVTTGEEHLWWTPVTALLVPSSLLDAALSAAVALTVMAYIERLIGTARTVLAYFGVGVVAIMAGIGLHLLTILLGTPLLVLARPELTLDPAIGIFAVLMCGSAFAPVLFRRRIRLIGFAVVLTFALYGGDQDSFYRVIAALLGLGLGALLGREMPAARSGAPVPARSWRRMSFAESRTLTAAVVAVTGVGLVIVLLTRTVTGPLALVVSGYAQVNGSEAFESCATYFRSDCDLGAVHPLARGLGAVLVSLVPVAMSLVAAWGLRAGRRAAWVAAVVVNAVSLVATGTAVGILTLITPVQLERMGERFALAALLAVGVPAAVLVALWLCRHRFALPSGRAAARRFAWTTGAALAVVVTVWAVAGAVTGGLGLPLGFRAIFGRFLDVLLPAGLVRALPHTGSAPRGVLALVDEWAGVAFWVVVIVGLVVLLRAADRRDASDSARFRAVLRESGGGTLGFLGTWAGTQHWIDADGRGALAYRVIGGVALAIADPVCEPGREAGVISGFLALCDRQGLTPVFYSIHAQALTELRRRGWRYVSIGEETVVSLPGLELTGGLWKRVRQALAKAERQNLRTVWARWDELPAAMAAQIEALSEHWVAEKALPELGFTLGGLAELRDPDVLLLLAVDADDVLHAVTSWLPSWRGGVRVGWTLDFMRRSDEAMAEIMVYLIASAALRMRDAGIEVMSLSGAPLATRPRTDTAPPPATSLLSRLLVWLAEVLEPVYGFRSLFEFKKKFHPEFETIYMAYADSASLPAAGRAIVRAYLPAISPRQTLDFVRTLSARHD